MIKYIKELNKIMTKIKNNANFKFDLIILLPLIYFMKTNKYIKPEEFNMIITNDSLKIKELKHY